MTEQTTSSQPLHFCLASATAPRTPATLSVVCTIGGITKARLMCDDCLGKVQGFVQVTELTAR